MTVQETLDQLKYGYHGKFPRKAFLAAIEQREAITPGLLAILEHAIANPEEVAQDGGYIGPLCAMYLLGEFREPRAYPLLVRFCRLDQHHVDDIVGDLVTEGLDRILASVCAGDIGPMQAMVEDATLNEFTRSAALSGLAVLVVEDVIPCEAVVAYFRELFHGRLEREYSFVWSQLACVCADLGAAELLPEIERAYAAGLCDPFVAGLDELRRDLAHDHAIALPALKRKRSYRFISDAVNELGSWACFQNPRGSSPKPLPHPAMPGVAGSKIPRNAPCPCGSGRKYKVCCGP